MSAGDLVGPRRKAAKGKKVAKAKKGKAKKGAKRKGQAQVIAFANQKGGVA